MEAMWFTLMVAALLMVCAYLDQGEVQEEDAEPVTVAADEEGGQ